VRIAPAGGYDFSRKRDYRRQVWATFRDRLKARRVSLASAQALLMPSLEGDEIEVAMNAGFREANLHVVDMEPAVVATLKRRFPKINTYGVTASRAVERIRDAGVRLDCANFDFCSNASISMFSELTSVSIHGQYMATVRPNPVDEDKRALALSVLLDGTSRGAFTDETLVAVSMLRGREIGAINSLWRSDSFDMNSVRSTLTTKFGPMRGDALTNPAMRYMAWLEPLSNLDRHRTLFVAKALSLRLRSLPVREGARPSAEFIRGGSYLSSNGQTMMWTIWCVRSAAMSVAHGLAADLVRLTRGIELLGSGYGELFRSGYDQVAAHTWTLAKPMLESYMAKNPVLRPFLDDPAPIIGTAMAAVGIGVDWGSEQRLP
jgi:hypothetical protein